MKKGRCVCCVTAENGTNGQNGQNGPNGPPGSPGVPGPVSNFQSLVNSVIPFTSSLQLINSGDNLPFSVELTPPTSSFATFASPGWILVPGKYWITIILIQSSNLPDTTDGSYFTLVDQLDGPTEFGIPLNVNQFISSSTNSVQVYDFPVTITGSQPRLVTYQFQRGNFPGQIFQLEESTSPAQPLGSWIIKKMS